MVDFFGHLPSWMVRGGGITSVAGPGRPFFLLTGQDWDQSGVASGASLGRFWRVQRLELRFGVLGAVLGQNGPVTGAMRPMVTELRDLGAGDGTQVVYTEDEGTRQRLKRMPAFLFETHYFCGHCLVAVDLYFRDGSPAGLRRQLVDLVPSLTVS